MKVRELIEFLGKQDPETEVYTIATCECCTHFVPVEEGLELGIRDVSRDYDGRHQVLSSLAHAPKEYPEEALVIAGEGWALPEEEE